MIENGYIKAFGINYVGALPKIKKSSEILQPVFEAFTNSLEAIKIADNQTNDDFINLKICFRKDLFSSQSSSLNFESFIIEDSGIGFNDKEFERLINLNDSGKGFFNKGSGRVQFLHYFDKTEVTSIFKDSSSSTNYKLRKFTLSKTKAFLENNAIIRHDKLIEIEAKRPSTEIAFYFPLETTDQSFYKSLSLIELKENLINRYLPFFCENRDNLIKIRIQQIVDDILLDELEIKSDDIPIYEKQKDIVINYCKVSVDGKIIEIPNKSEKLNLKGFKIDKDRLKKNGLKLTSKGEIAKDLKLDCLLVDDDIDGNRYLFLLSGDYINNRDTDTRGNLNIPTLEDFKKKNDVSESIFSDEEILLDDIRDKANAEILKLYDEIVIRTKEKEKEIEELQKMFLLNPDSIKDAKIKLSDTEEEILEKVYKADAKLVAKKDAEIKIRVDLLKHLNPSSKDFQNIFNKEVEELTKLIPLQNRTALTHYVARRKLVLELYSNILEKKLNVQEIGNRNNDEKLLHNLIFQQRSKNPENSDLWLVNEDFLYFDGTSEGKLGEIEHNSVRIMKGDNELNQEEIKY
ncbi:MAG: ATP-binding protein, partial [Cytophagales bacterium]|nr:ATP-binding protein [Cytophagales bacterium]